MEIGINRTLTGDLMPHVPMGTFIVWNAINQMPDFPQDLGTQLLHLISSHPGRIEWGAFQSPRTYEAFALHYIDQVSCNMNMYTTEIGRAPQEADLTNYIPRLGRRLHTGQQNGGNWFTVNNLLTKEDNHE